MTSKVILKKKSSQDTFGYLGIRYFNGSGEKKVLSLGERIDEEDFKNFFNSEFNLFSKTELIDYKVLNKKIKDKIDDYSIFDVKSNKNKLKSFLQYYDSYLELISNPSTKYSYSSGLKKLNEFIKFKNKTDILFKEIDRKFVVELKDFLLKDLSTNSVIQYLVIIKTVLNSSKRDKLYYEDYNYFSKLNLKSTYSNKKILSKNDIDTLMNVSNYSYRPRKGDPDFIHFDTRNMLLFSLLCSGIRVSDLFLMRNKDFKKDYIEIITKKTSLNMRIPYNDQLLRLLLDICGLYDSTLPLGTGYYGVPLFGDENKSKRETKNIDYNKKQILNHISKLPPNDFVFQNFMKNETSLITFDKTKEFTPEQFGSMNRLRGTYNSRLESLRKYYNLEVEKISSHTGRYTWTNLLLSLDGVNLVDIKRSLGHKRISTTESYIEKNFGLEKMENVGSKLSNSLID